MDFRFRGISESAVYLHSEAYFVVSEFRSEFRSESRRNFRILNLQVNLEVRIASTASASVTSEKSETATASR